MATRTIGELVAPIIVAALGMGRLQEFLDTFAPEDRRYWIMEWWDTGTVSADEAVLLLDHNKLDAA